MQMRQPAILAILVLVAAAAAVAAGPAEPSPRSVSFIVSAKNPIRNVSVGDLRRIFLGEISRWENGHRIVLFVRPAEAAEGRLFLDRLVRMSDIDYSQWWLGAVFRGRAAAAPRIISGSDLMVKAVASDADAIGFVATSPAVEGDVVVLAIDGTSPANPAYPVRSR
jgi:ABC-type phosphate transport system substrate-binding protein